MTRNLGAPIVVSNDLPARAQQEASCLDGEFDDFEKKPGKAVRALEQPLNVWTLGLTTPTMGTA